MKTHAFPAPRPFRSTCGGPFTRRASILGRSSLPGIVVALGFAASACAQSFEATNASVGGNFSHLLVINAAGQAAGYARWPDMQMRATFVARGVALNLDPSGLWKMSSCQGLNASGRAFGVMRTDAYQHGFMWSAETGVIDVTPDADVAVLRYINDAGQIAGIVRRGTETHLVVRTADGIPITVPLGTSAYVTAMNAAGQVVGWRQTATSSAQAFSWTLDGGLIVPAPGAQYSIASFLSESGQVAGAIRPAPSSQDKFFVWTAAEGLRVVDSPAGGPIQANDMNEAGEVVGYYTKVGERCGFIWKSATGVVDIPSAGIPWPYPSHITNGGVVTGQGSNRAFVWTEAGGSLELSFGGSTAAVEDVDETGKVVGWAYNAAGERRAFMWTSASGMVDLGSLGGSDNYAYRILADGRVIGKSSTSGKEGYRAFIHDGFVMKDLNALIVNAPPGVVFDDATLPHRYLPRNSFVASAGDEEYLISPAGPPPAAPVIDPIVALPDPACVNTTVSVGAGFTDANALDTHTAIWSWSDGTPDLAGLVSESAGAGSVSGLHAFAAAGVYTISLTVTDSTNRASVAKRNVVVYDPAAGFVTGGCWIEWPAGAWKPDARLSGKANISFVVRYEKGAEVPTGNLEVQLHGTHLKFRSTSLEWLVVRGARAQWEGTGTLDGQDGYHFKLTAIDGDLIGRRVPDRVRLQLWYFDPSLGTEIVVFDNELSAADGTLTEGTELGGGSITIHSGKEKP